MRKLIVASFLCLMIAAGAEAGVGTSGGQFLLMGGGARSLAMGEAFVALADDSAAVFWNPAGLARMSFPGLNYMHNEWFVDINHQYFDFAYPTENGTFGGSYSLLDSGNIQGYDAGGSMEAIFKAQNTALTFSWGRMVNDRLSLGANLKSISESLENFSATSTALDLGLLFDLNANWRFGAAIQNIGSPLKFVTEETPLPQTQRFGLAYQSGFFDDDISLAVDSVSSAGSSGGINLGFEYLFRNLLALRVGTSKGTLRAGAGVMSGQFGLDYAYLSHNDLGAAHQISFAYSFASQDKRKAEVLRHLTLAKAYYNQNKFAETVVEIKKALLIDPEHAASRSLLTKAQRALETGSVEEVKEEIKAEKDAEIKVFLDNGRKFIAEKLYLEAITELNKALRISPSHPETVKLLREAQAALEAEVSARVKEEAREHLGLALKYITTEDYSEALKEVEEVLKIDPGNVEALKLMRKLRKLTEIENKE
ncbi:PorV/PorQ family protein [Candidatus Margulisiibacteriota bacterium]